jgi:hypothetical protein
MTSRQFYIMLQWLVAFVVLVGLERWAGGATWGHSVALALLITAVGAAASQARNRRRREKNNGTSHVPRR